MCGILAVFYNDEVDMPSLKVAWDKGVVRGPDNSALEHNTRMKYILGFHRLAINGMSQVSNQPLRIQGVTLICNGEVYNYKELYAMMPDVRAQTESDCEVIIHIFIRYGIDYLMTCLDAEYAFVLIDQREGDIRVFVSRDSYGVRPLYVAENDSSLVFSSTLAQMPHRHDVKHVTPGTYLDFGLQGAHDDEGVVTQHTYNNTLCACYDVTIPQEVGPTLYEKLRMVFTNAVRKRVNSTERPIACLLSGGLDSSIVTALTSAIMKENGSTEKLKTFSIGMPGGTDLAYAKRVAEWCGTDHTEIILTPERFLKEIPNVIKAVESYDVTTVRASVGNYLVAKYIAENSQCKVVLNGDGSDELMGGYLYFRNAPCAMSFDKECRRLLTDIHMFDALRSDRAVSHNGLEARTPFLDRSWVQWYLSLPPVVRFTPDCEKKLFRSAWSGMGVLPEDVLWRTKEAFSDGVSSTESSWHVCIQETLDKIGSTEKSYYKAIYTDEYGGDSCVLDLIPYYWMPKWCDTDDPSARCLVFSEGEKLV